MKYRVVSIDIAKNVFQVCGLNQHKKPAFNKKIPRAKLLETIAQLDCDSVVMEACYASNPWGRAIEALGFKVNLIPPYQVKPFLVGNKNDHNDAIAIAEASQRPTARFAPVKTLEQQEIQSLNRIRERLVKHRTSAINQLHGLLSEYGVIAPKGPNQLMENIPSILEDGENALTPIAREFVQDLQLEIIEANKKIEQNEIKTIALLKTKPSYELLQTVRGIGPITAAAIIASVNDGKQFKNGRNMAAWAGLTPSQYASGEKCITGGITKRGNAQLRKLFIHGARAVINWREKKEGSFSYWIKGLLARMHPCKAIVAVANKIARMAWAVLTKQEAYNPNLA